MDAWGEGSGGNGEGKSGSAEVEIHVHPDGPLAAHNHWVETVVGGGSWRNRRVGGVHLIPAAKPSEARQAVVRRWMESGVSHAERGARVFRIGDGGAIPRIGEKHVGVRQQSGERTLRQKHGEILFEAALFHIGQHALGKNCHVVEAPPRGGVEVGGVIHEPDLAPRCNGTGLLCESRVVRSVTDVAKGARGCATGRVHGFHADALRAEDAIIRFFSGRFACKRGAFDGIEAGLHALVANPERVGAGARRAAAGCRRIDRLLGNDDAVLRMRGEIHGAVADKHRMVAGCADAGDGRGVARKGHARRVGGRGFVSGHEPCERLRVELSVGGADVVGDFARRVDGDIARRRHIPHAGPIAVRVVGGDVVRFPLRAGGAAVECRRGGDALVGAGELLEFAEGDVEAEEGVLAGVGDLAGVVGRSHFNLQEDGGADDRDDEQCQHQHGQHEGETARRVAGGGWAIVLLHGGANRAGNGRC